MGDVDSFFPSDLEDAAFMEGYLSCLSTHRRFNFKLMYEAFRPLIASDNRVGKVVRRRFIDPAKFPRSATFQTILNHIRRAVMKSKINKDDCKSNTINAVKVMRGEPHFCLGIDDAVEFHENHLNGGDPQSYYKFFGCIGLMCTEIAAWGMDYHILKIIKEAEMVMNKYAASFPGYDKLSNYAE